jgi:hypothetical protein
MYVYYGKNKLLVLKKNETLLDKISGYLFYFLTCLIKFILLFVFGKNKFVWAELKANVDFFEGRYGNYGRANANNRL